MINHTSRYCRENCHLATRWARGQGSWRQLLTAVSSTTCLCNSPPPTCCPAPTLPSPHLPGAGAQFLETGEGVDGAPAFALLPQHAQLFQVPQLLHLSLQFLHLGLQALDGLRQPGGVSGGHMDGSDAQGTGPALLAAALAGLGGWPDRQPSVWLLVESRRLVLRSDEEFLGQPRTHASAPPPRPSRHFSVSPPSISFFSNLSTYLFKFTHLNKFTYLFI